MTEQLEQTTKIRYVIQNRTQYLACEYGIHRFWQDCQVAGCKQIEKFSEWRDGAGYKQGEGGQYKFIFTHKEYMEALKSLKLARRRKHAYKTEYRLVRQESIWTTVG